MHTKTSLAVLGALAFAAESVALNHHRHAHMHAHNKARELDARKLHKHVEWVTEYVTVTVVRDREGHIKTVGPNSYFANEKPDAVEPAPAVKSPEAPEKSPQEDAAAAPPPSPANVEPAATKPAEPASNDRQGDKAAAPPAAPPAKADPPAVAAPVAPADTASKNNQQQSAPQAPGGGKRGFAYNDCQLVNNFKSGGGLSWAYNWDSHHNGLTAPVEFVPMLWGDIDVHTSRWHNNAEKMLSSGSTHLLSFNECDNAGQANMSPSHAAQAHVKYMNPYSSRARIGSPAITNSNIPGESVDWLKSWVSECKGECHFDFCVTHWYNLASTSTEDFKGYLDSVHEACGNKPIWLTEFAPLGSDDEIARFLEKNLPMLDSLPYLERHSYFMMSVGSLLQAPNTPSKYGRTYLG